MKLKIQVETAKAIELDPKKPYLIVLEMKGTLAIEQTSAIRKALDAQMERIGIVNRSVIVISDGELKVSEVQN